ncbi:MAG: N-6 DNA methylase [Candidatus Sedimenticola sp. (ex Thyasira tokunagai)]
MQQLQHIEAIEKRLWKAADTLRSNSELASNEYFMPVMGLIFLRHAYSRYLKTKVEIEQTLPSRGGKTRALTKEDFSGRGAIFLNEAAQFDTLVSLSDADDRAEAVISAMESIEKDYTGLTGQLPKQEYRDIPNDVLGQLLRTLNPDELKKADGDIFGRIYEYFLTQFANQGAHDGGEFFTPISLVQMIVNIIEPGHGKVLDPACGSGGMFVQSAHLVEQQQKNPGQELTFYGHEKNKTTTRLAKMNLRVHGLEGNIAGGVLSYYDDPHDGLWGDVDFVMANPPFNVDEVDAGKIKTDRRLPFGLPGVNKGGKVSNGNYLWISYFYSYLNDTGRAGFVMSSQASSAGGGEAQVRQALVETGHVDAMVDIRSNFFYTRSVPCQLWFLNKNKPEAHRNKVLMLDARHVFRKVTRKIYDFSPEQLANLSSIVWLYRGQHERFIELVQDHISNSINAAWYAFFVEESGGQDEQEEYLPIKECIAALKAIEKVITPFYQQQTPEHQTHLQEFSETVATLTADSAVYAKAGSKASDSWYGGAFDKPKQLNKLIKPGGTVEQLAETSRDLIKQLDLAYKLASRLIDTAEKELSAKDADNWEAKKISSGRDSLKKQAEASRADAVEQLKQVRYFFKQAHWLLSRFPDAQLMDVEGLVKLVDIKEIEANDWSLTPGRYVGVAPEEEDEEFDFEETLRDIHVELEGLNEEAVVLAEKIAQNFRELGA